MKSIVVTLNAYIWCHTPVSGKKNCFRELYDMTWYLTCSKFKRPYISSFQSVKFIIQMVISYCGGNNYMEWIQLQSREDTDQVNSKFSIMTHMFQSWTIFMKPVLAGMN